MGEPRTTQKSLQREVERLRRRVAKLEREKEIGYRQVRQECDHQQNLLSTVVDKLVDPVFAKDTESRFILANPACVRRLRAASVEEVLGRTDLDFFPPAQAAMYREEELRIIRTGEPLVNREMAYLDREGRPYWYVTTKVPLRDKSGRVIGLIGTMRDITAQKQAERLLREANEKLEARVAERTSELTEVIRHREQIEVELHSYLAQIRKLTLDKEKSLEEQKAWISKELHDELGQLFTALKMSLVWLGEHASGTDSRVQERFGEAVGLANRCMDTVRNLSKSLRPSLLDQHGLLDAIRAHVSEFEHRYGIACEVTAKPADLEVADPAWTAAFRIVQEALTNVARHARASRCQVILEREGENLHLQVCDDGIGAPRERLSGALSLGILGMQERAGAVGGTLRVGNRPEGGIRVVACLPCESPAGAPA